MGKRDAKYLPSSTFRRPFWVLLFDCESCSNKKENSFLLVPEFVPYLVACCTPG